MRASIIIRTFNESEHLPKLLRYCQERFSAGSGVEIIVVDSGSTDGSREIAAAAGARVLSIDKQDFTFGRSLNLGCEAARGEFLVFISGHCMPLCSNWLDMLLAPLENGSAAYAYGKQVGGKGSRFSETQLFRKHFPEQSKNPQDGFFCNNANAALPRSIWKNHRFNEELTGLEDMELAKRLVNYGHRIAYAADATVLHFHNESWHKIRMRYEREARALQRIMPHVHVTSLDFLRYYASAVGLDIWEATRTGQLRNRLGEILMFRLMQYWGTYRGNRDHRRLSQEAKEEYFYPR